MEYENRSKLPHSEIVQCSTVSRRESSKNFSSVKHINSVICHSQESGWRMRFWMLLTKVATEYHRYPLQKCANGVPISDTAAQLLHTYSTLQVQWPFYIKNLCAMIRRYILPATRLLAQTSTQAGRGSLMEN